MFFSIIIPLYNKYTLIKDSINLITQQVFTNYEIILVDDGSKDNTFDLCKELKNKYPFIKIIHQENCGVGSARKKGIQYAKGEYICFFDIDDKVKTDWLEKIYELIIIENPDVLIYSYHEINPKLKTLTTFKFQDKSYFSNKEIKSDFIENLSGIKFNNGFVWNKVYKREFLIQNNIKFPDLRIQEDEVFNHKVYMYANSLITSSKVLYDYYIYEKENSRNTFIQDRLKIFQEVKESFLNLSEHWHLDNSDLHYYIHSRFVRNCLFNRNPVTFETIKSYTNNLLQNKSLNESARFMFKKSKYLPIIERLYIKSIIKKSKSLFLFAEFISQFISKGKFFHQRIVSLIRFT